MILDGILYGNIHYLRRFFAYNLVHDEWTPEVFDSEANPADDSILENESSSMYSHLLTHSDCEEFYIPQEFDDIIFETKETPVK
ncbi:hypothetical protein [Leeuwenhoekiella marinoflava]|uniref:Uncharacterized protein n=2 Tax=Leeuwenhoekiella marinoflava TaxID=988 RepID=A0A4Q0PPA9_9FLAO|nr:hypothetical protein [Leeuwenhoekiella marinoflava]RXG32294.1 hypothetical protein DSL99_1100 [Leeuwenhoekiella marinoflava]SHE80162.1 hypothetical protein SAMN02745246_01059 [Leeuwenhoekiella marinoflava DSM 3653]